MLSVCASQAPLAPVGCAGGAIINRRPTAEDSSLGSGSFPFFWGEGLTLAGLKV